MIKILKKWWRLYSRKVVYDEMADVLAFYEKFGQHVAPKPRLANPSRVIERINFMQEELNEFNQASATSDLAGQADALIDLVYVAKGTALELGLPWEALWLDVQRANMAKVAGRTHRDIKIDVAKPPGWQPPMTEAIIREYQ